MAYGKPKRAVKISDFGGADQEARKRHTGSAMAKKLGSGANVARHSSTHMKSRMRRY